MDALEGTATGAVAGGMNSPHCFVAGTLVCTVDGEEFTTTEGHPFYTLGRGFVKAGELRYSDTLVDANGAKLHLDEKSKAHLENPVTVYNFAVEDYHTYFVGENDVLVHNMCAVKSIDLSNKSVNHILNRHSFTKFEQEAAHLTDEELAAKLAKRTFFNKNLSNEQILDYVQEAYNILRSQNKFGENIIEIHGELMKVYIKADGTFDTAFGVFKYFVSDFR